MKMNLSLKTLDKNSDPLVFILLLNWNGKEHLKYALTSVMKTNYPNYELVMIDNASTDGSMEYVTMNFPQVSTLCNKQNLRWPGGNNAGVRYAMGREAKYVALLNNDVKVDSRWLAQAVKVAEEREEVGCVGFRVFNEYRDEDRDGRQFEAAKLAWDKLEVKETNHISGCALFIRTEVFDHIGFFDEVYVAYGEEDDFEKRAKRAGYKMVRINVPLWHHSMGYWGQVPLHASRLTMRNTLRCSLKNDNWKGIFNQFIQVASVACNPFSTADPIYFHYRRLRPSNIFINAMLLLYALGWNLLFLPKTLALRKRVDSIDVS